MYYHLNYYLVGMFVPFDPIMVLVSCFHAEGYKMVTGSTTNYNNCENFKSIRFMDDIRLYVS